MLLKSFHKQASPDPPLRYIDQIHTLDRQLVKASFSDARLFASFWLPLLGFVTAIVSSLVLVGWLLKNESLTHVFSDFASMQPNTALAFLVSGIALALNSKIFPAYKFRHFQLLLCIFAAALSLIDFLSYYSLGARQLHISIIDVEPIGTKDSRMSLMTAFSFLLLSFGLALLLLYRRKSTAIAVGLGVGVLLIALFALITYFVAGTAIYLIESFESMAIHTSALFFIMSIGLLGVCFSANFQVVARMNSNLVMTGFLIWLFVAFFEFLSTRAIVANVSAVPPELASLLDVRTVMAIIFSAGLIAGGAALMAIKNYNQETLEQRLRDNQQRLNSIMNSTAEGIYGIDREGNCIFANQSCVEMLGYSSRKELIGKNLHSLFHHSYSDGSKFPIEDCPIYRSLSTSEKVHVNEDVFWRKDKTSIPVEYWSYPLIRRGNAIGSVVTFVNITERKKDEDTRQFLMREVNHRANNLLAVVQTIARQTSKEKYGEDFSKALLQRLQSLASSQDLIIKADWQVVSLESLISNQFSMLGMKKNKRYTASGPEIRLSPQATQGIGMAIHELATNSLKYGALSSEQGRVTVTWLITEIRNVECLALRWLEENGPIVQKPLKKGFGSTVIERLASDSVDGTVELEFKPSGLVWKLICPLQAATKNRGTRHSQGETLR